MFRNATKIICLLLFIIAMPNVFGQQIENDLVNKVIVQLFRDHNTKFLCLNEDSSLPAIRAIVETQLKSMELGSAESQNSIATVVYTQFPCPLSPFRKGIRRASVKDIEGVWLFPENSQYLRFGPKSPQWQSQVSLPIKCEVVAYDADGGTSNIQAAGSKVTCPFTSAKDMEAASFGSPKVSTWTLVKDGKVKIHRTDVQDHTEEWDVFVVESAFQAGKTLINSGDLLAYRRRDKGNELNVSTMFRHLRKLQ